MNKKGFTLIELIMVIAILGILAAYAVPKFFSLADTAKEKTWDQLAVEINSGIRMYGIHQLATNTGIKNYPTPAEIIADMGIILDDWDDGMIFTVDADSDSGFFTYDTKTLGYRRTAGSPISYKLDKTFNY